MSQTALAPIQVMRAFAAICVAIVHFNSLWLILKGLRNTSLTLYPFASGVDIFFVISGFIMVYSSEQLFGQTHAHLIFLAKRIARIVPLYWATMTIAIFVQQTPIELITLFKSYLFIPFIEPDGDIYPLYGIGWTLQLEILFYFLFAGVICFKRAVAVIAAVGLLGAIVLFGQLTADLPAPLRFWSDPILLEFAFGMGLALLYRGGVRLPTVVCAGILLFGAGALWWSGMVLAPRIPPSNSRVVTWGIPAMLIVAGVILRRSVGGPARRSPFGRLGDASYSIYLIHPLVVAAIIRLWPLGLDACPMWQIMIIGGALTLALSVASFYLFERPSTRAVQKVLLAFVERAPHLRWFGPINDASFQPAIVSRHEPGRR
jgi:peptidoglycan/LPS O-acetylase OafA/YrhL